MQDRRRVASIVEKTVVFITAFILISFKFHARRMRRVRSNILRPLAFLSKNKSMLERAPSLNDTIRIPPRDISILCSWTDFARSYLNSPTLYMSVELRCRLFNVINHYNLLYKNKQNGNNLVNRVLFMWLYGVCIT